MKKLVMVLAVMLSLALAMPAMAADHNCQGNSCNDNDGTIIIGDGNVGGDDVDVTVNEGDTTQTNNNSNSNSNSNSYVNEDKRELARGHGEAYSVNGPAFNSEPNRTGNVQDSADILQIRKKFSLRMLQALEAGEDLDLIVKAYQDKRVQLERPKRGYKNAKGWELNLDDEVEIIVVVPQDMSKYVDIAHITVRGDDDTTTMGAIAAAAVEAYRHGSDTLLITGEGAEKVLQASGWGVMFGGSASMIGGDTGKAAAGAVIAPGVGYASAKTAYGFCPYLQAFGLDKLETIVVK